MANHCLCILKSLRILRCPPLFGTPELQYTLKTKKERNFCFSLQYPDPGSNRDGLPHWCLRPARLPIPPSGQLLNCGAKVVLFFVRANKNVIFLKKSCNCLPVPVKRSNFASRLLSAHTMGIRYFRSLSMPRIQSSQLIGYA